MNYGYLKIQSYLKISINPVMDTKNSPDIRIPLNQIMNILNGVVLKDIHNSFKDILKSIYNYP